MAVMSEQEYREFLQDLSKLVYKHRREVIEKSSSWSHLDMLAELFGAFEDAVNAGTPKLDGNGEIRRVKRVYHSREQDVPDVWNEDSTFEEYLQYTDWFLGKQLEFAKGFVQEKKTPIAHIMGDGIANQMDAIPPGLDQVYGDEEFEVLEMLTRKQKESIAEFLEGRITLEEVMSHYLEVAKEEGNAMPIRGE